MSPPIYTPDGTEVSEIVLPDGSTASQVIGPDGNVVFEAGPDIPDSGISRWTFNDEDISSGTLTDVWGSNDGTIEGMTTTTGIYPHDSSEAGDFDGNDDRVLFDGIPEISGESEFSIAVWINMDTVNYGDDAIIIGGYPNTSDAVRFSVFDGALRALVETNGTSAVAQGGTLTTGTTYLTTMTFNSGTVTAYIDDTEVEAGTGGPSVGPSINIYAAYQGSDNVVYTDGRMDEGRLYSKELSASEVSNLYNTGSISD